MISIMIASRHRPQWLEETIKTALETADKPNELEFIVRYDNDDDETHNFIINNTYNIIPLRKVRMINKSVFFNEMAEVASYDILGGFSDDFRFRTKGWDTIVENVYKNNSPLTIVWGKDGIQDEKLTTHFFCTKQFKKCLGYIWHEDLLVAYSDNFMTDQAKMSGLAMYTDTLYFEHLHPDVGKAQRDDVYNESHLKAGTDGVRYRRMKFELEASVKKLMECK